MKTRYTSYDPFLSVETNQASAEAPLWAGTNFAGLRTHRDALIPRRTARVHAPAGVSFPSAGSRLLPLPHVSAAVDPCRSRVALSPRAACPTARTSPPASSRAGGCLCGAMPAAPSRWPPPRAIAHGHGRRPPLVVSDLTRGKGNRPGRGVSREIGRAHV